jgi:ribonucleoside-triphosphate reductase
MGERVSSSESCKKLVRRALEGYRIPYITITPTFSICPTHGYLPGEHEFCTKCDQELINQKMFQQPETAGSESAAATEIKV